MARVFSPLVMQLLAIALCYGRRPKVCTKDSDCIISIQNCRMQFGENEGICATKVGPKTDSRLNKNPMYRRGVEMGMGMVEGMEIALRVRKKLDRASDVPQEELCANEICFESKECPSNMILRVVEFCILQNEKTPERIKHECLDCVPLDPQIAGNQPLRGPGYEYIELVKS